MKKQTIVIVDDDADDRDIIRDAFFQSRNEAEYILLNSSEQLMTYLRETADALPDIIILDLNMPGKDGKEVLKELKAVKEYHHIPVIIFTTSSSPKDRHIAYSSGANCFITKPDTFNQLVHTANCILQLWLPQ